MNDGVSPSFFRSISFYVTGLVVLVLPTAISFWIIRFGVEYELSNRGYCNSQLFIDIQIC